MFDLNPTTSIELCQFGFTWISSKFAGAPAYFDVDIPEGIDAIYLGTFNYYVTGDNFTISDIELLDEYDLAQEELDRSLGKHCDMARAVLKIVEE